MCFAERCRAWRASAPAALPKPVEGCTRHRGDAQRTPCVISAMHTLSALLCPAAAHCRTQQPFPLLSALPCFALPHSRVLPPAATSLTPGSRCARSWRPTRCWSAAWGELSSSITSVTLALLVISAWGKTPLGPPAVGAPTLIAPWMMCSHWHWYGHSGRYAILHISVQAVKCAAQ